MNKLSLGMLIKNEEDIIDLPLNSVKDLVDKIIIIHDGLCGDNSRRIIKKFCENNSIPYYFKEITDERQGHYGKLRQEILNLCDTEWILWLDADDLLTTNCLDYIN